MGTPPVAFSPGSGATPISRFFHMPVAIAALMRERLALPSIVIAALWSPSARKWSMVLRSVPTLMARPESTMRFHHVQMARPVGLSIVAAVARAVRPLPLFTSVWPAFAAMNSW